jgi:hypothetical protein
MKTLNLVPYGIIHEILALLCMNVSRWDNGTRDCHDELKDFISNVTSSNCPRLPLHNRAMGQSGMYDPQNPLPP